MSNAFDNKRYREDYEKFLSQKSTVQKEISNIDAKIMEAKSELNEFEMKKKDINSNKKRYNKANLGFGDWAALIGYGAAMSLLVYFVVSIVIFEVLGIKSETDYALYITGIIYFTAIIVYIICLNRYNARHRLKLIAEIEKNINEKTVEIEQYEKALKMAKRQYELILKSEPKKK